MKRGRKTMSDEKQAKEQGYLAHRRESKGRHNICHSIFKGLMCKVEILLWIQDKTRASKNGNCRELLFSLFDKLTVRAPQKWDELPHKVVSSLSLEVFQNRQYSLTFYSTFSKSENFPLEEFRKGHSDIWQVVTLK